MAPEAEFLDVIGTKVLRVFLLANHNHPFIPSKSGLKMVLNENIVYGNLKYENTQEYAQKPQQTCTLMNLASAEA
jgi:hypothetical protein